MIPSYLFPFIMQVLCVSSWSLKRRQSQGTPEYMMKFGIDPGGGEYEVHNYISMSDSGIYTIGMWVYVTSDYDGEERFTHSRWWSSNVTLNINKAHGTTTGLVSPPRDKWTYITETFIATEEIFEFSLYIAYPKKNSNGYVYVTGVSVLGPDGTEYIGNGDFSNGNGIEQAYGSYGTYKIIKIADNGEISEALTYSPTTYPTEMPITTCFGNEKSQLENLKALVRIRAQPCLTDIQCQGRENFDNAAYCLDFACSCSDGVTISSPCPTTE